MEYYQQKEAIRFIKDYGWWIVGILGFIIVYVLIFQRT